MSDALLTKIQEQFPETSWATDEFGETIDISDDPYLARIESEGELFKPTKAFVCDSPLGHCHEAIASIWKDERQPGDSLYTGFALHHSSDEWFSHSFIVNNGTVVEPGPKLYRAYLGVSLNGNDLQAFLYAWGEEQPGQDIDL